MTTPIELLKSLQLGNKMVKGEATEKDLVEHHDWLVERALRRVRNCLPVGFTVRFNEENYTIIIERVDRDGGCEIALELVDTVRDISSTVLYLCSRVERG